MDEEATELRRKTMLASFELRARALLIASGLPRLQVRHVTLSERVRMWLITDTHPLFYAALGFGSMQVDVGSPVILKRIPPTPEHRGLLINNQVVADALCAQAIIDIVHLTGDGCYKLSMVVDLNTNVSALEFYNVGEDSVDSHVELACERVKLIEAIPIMVYGPERHYAGKYSYRLNPFRLVIEDMNANLAALCWMVFSGTKSIEVIDTQN